VCAVSTASSSFLFAKKRNGTKENFALRLPKDPSEIHKIGGRSDSPSMAQLRSARRPVAPLANLVNFSGANPRGIAAP